jgi:hypothetical protein
MMKDELDLKIMVRLIEVLKMIEEKFHSIPTLSKPISIKTPMFCGPSSERLISRLFMALVSKLLS